MSSASKITTSASVSAHDAASVTDFSGAQKRGRIRLGPLLQHAQDDGRARRFGQPAELVERPLGLEPFGPTGDQPDQRRPFLSRHTFRHAHPRTTNAPLVIWDYLGIDCFIEWIRDTSSIP